MSVHKAQWTNGKRVISGCWVYVGSDRFNITLYVKDTLTGGDQRNISTYGDTPEWGKWRLVRDPA